MLKDPASGRTPSGSAIISDFEKISRSGHWLGNWIRHLIKAHQIFGGIDFKTAEMLLEQEKDAVEREYLTRPSSPKKPIFGERWLNVGAILISLLALAFSGLQYRAVNREVQLAKNAMDRQAADVEQSRRAAEKSSEAAQKLVESLAAAVGNPPRRPTNGIQSAATLPSTPANTTIPSIAVPSAPAPSPAILPARKSPILPSAPALPSVGHDANYFYQEARRYADQEELFARAILFYSQALELDPNFALALNGRCYAHLRLREYSQAIADCTEAIRLNPSYANAYQNRGAARRLQGDPAGASEDFHRVAELQSSVR